MWLDIEGNFLWKWPPGWIPRACTDRSHHFCSRPPLTLSWREFSILNLMLLCFELVGFMGVIKNELRVIFNLMYKRWKLTIAHIQISGGIRLLAARAEQDEQVVDGKMSVEMPAPAAHLPSCLLVFLSHLLCKQGSTLHYKKSRGSSGAISIWSIVGRKVTTACARAALRNMESTNLPITTSLWLRSLVESGMKSISGATIKQTPTARNMKPGAIQTTEPHWHLGSAFHSSCLLLLLVD